MKFNLSTFCFAVHEFTINHLVFLSWAKIFWSHITHIIQVLNHSIIIIHKDLLTGSASQYMNTFSVTLWKSTPTFLRTAHRRTSRTIACKSSCSLWSCGRLATGHSWSSIRGLLRGRRIWIANGSARSLWFHSSRSGWYYSRFYKTQNINLAFHSRLKMGFIWVQISNLFFLLETVFLLSIARLVLEFICYGLHSVAYRHILHTWTS